MKYITLTPERARDFGYPPPYMAGIINDLIKKYLKSEGGHDTATIPVVEFRALLAKKFRFDVVRIFKLTWPEGRLDSYGTLHRRGDPWGPPVAEMSTDDLIELLSDTRAHGARSHRPIPEAWEVYGSIDEYLVRTGWMNVHWRGNPVGNSFRSDDWRIHLINGQGKTLPHTSQIEGDQEATHNADRPRLRWLVFTAPRLPEDTPVGSHLDGDGK